MAGASARQELVTSARVVIVFTLYTQRAPIRLLAGKSWRPRWARRSMEADVRPGALHLQGVRFFSEVAPSSSTNQAKPTSGPPRQSWPAKGAQAWRGSARDQGANAHSLGSVKFRAQGFFLNLRPSSHDEAVSDGHLTQTLEADNSLPGFFPITAIQTSLLA